MEGEGRDVKMLFSLAYCELVVDRVRTEAGGEGKVLAGGSGGNSAVASTHS